MTVLSTFLKKRGKYQFTNNIRNNSLKLNLYVNCDESTEASCSFLNMNYRLLKCRCSEFPPSKQMVQRSDFQTMLCTCGFARKGLNSAEKIAYFKNRMGSLARW